MTGNKPLIFFQSHVFSRPKKRRAGFTLIELLIVSAVFSVAFLLATSVFVSVQSNQRGIAGRQRIVADGRYVLEAIARSIRLGTIDYAYYRDPNGNGDPSDAIALADTPAQLVVRDQQGIQTCYWQAGDALKTSSGGTACDGTEVTITSSDIIVTRFQAMITPLSDPFQGPRATAADCGSGTPTADGVCLCDDSLDSSDNDVDAISCLPDQRCVTTGGSDEICLNVNRQPTVTLVLETKSTNTDTGEQSAIALQTTVVSRVIKR